MHRYKYLGSKNRLGQASGSGRLSRTVEALMLTSEKSDARQQQLRHVFEFLGYAPTITVQYSLRITREAIDATVGAWQSGSHEHLRRELLRIDTPFRYRFQASETESWEMFAVAEAIAALADHGTKKNIVNFELSFESGEFQAGSLDLYVHVQTLRRFGLATLRSLRLDRQSDGASVELRDASSGEQSVVLTLLGIASEIESDSLVIIDEPEISLHPEWQERFLPLMLKTFENYSGCHFLLATHSPQILASMQALARGTIVLMDSGESTSAVGQSKKSADYQLATAFQSPGFGNEYLARIGLNALALINKRHLDSDELRAAVLTLRRARPKLSESDPVAMLADVVFAAEEFRQ